MRHLALFLLALITILLSACSEVGATSTPQVIVVKEIVSAINASGNEKPIEGVFPHWMEVVEGPLNIRTGPGTQYPVISDPRRPQLRSYLTVGDHVKVNNMVDGSCVDDKCLWYEIDEGYIHSSFVVFDNAPTPITFTCPQSGRRCVVVDRNDQSVHLIEDGTDIFRTWVCTGIVGGYETPLGVHRVWLQYEKQRMTGGVGANVYDLPDIRWISYFAGEVGFHSTYWHNAFGRRQGCSHGCVNMTRSDAKVVFDFVEVGTPVIVR